MTDPHTIAAIDPGVNGGFASLDYTKPIGDGDYEPFLHGSISVLYLEDVGFQVRHNNPASMGKLQRHMGRVEGACAAHGIRVELVTPTVWQQSCRAGRKSEVTAGISDPGKADRKWKNHLKDLAQHLYPDTKVTLATSDALLILHHAIKTEQKKNQ